MVLAWPPARDPGLGGPGLLTHGFQLPDELFFRPFRPLLLVGVDGAEDGATWLTAVLDGWDVQIVHQDDVGVLQGEYRDWQHEGGMEPTQGDLPAGADRLGVPTPSFLNLGTAGIRNQIILWFWGCPGHWLLPTGC